MAETNMRIRRYYGKTIRETIQKVRQEQGPDAVILSNRKVDDGIEIIAAVDFDEILLDVASRQDAPAAATQPTAATRQPPVVIPAAPAMQKPAVMASPVVSAQPTATVSKAQVAVPPVAAKTDLDRNVPAASKPNPAAPRARTPQSGVSVLTEMRRDMKNLKDMFEQQIAGLIWGESARRDPVRGLLLQRLRRLELCPSLCRDIIGQIQDIHDQEHAWRHALAQLSRRLPVCADNTLDEGGIIALIGPTGAGKTTTAAKLAARFSVRHGASKVAFITTDNYRIGAHDQLRTYAKILNIPMRVAADSRQLQECLQGLAERKLIIIDTAGMSQRDLALQDQLSMLEMASRTIRSFLVLPATTGSRVIDEILQRYMPIKPHACILTKLDESRGFGGILDLLIKNKLPLAYYSEGQCVPEDLSVVQAHQMISLCVALAGKAELEAEPLLTDSFAAQDMVYV